MSEKVYKATGQKQNLTFQNNCRQNQYYDNFGQLRTARTNYTEKIGEGDVDGLKWVWITQLDNATMTTTSEEVISSYIRFKWTNSEGVLGFIGKIEFRLLFDDKLVVDEQVDALVEFSGQSIGIRNLRKAEDVITTIQANQHQNQRPFGNRQMGCTMEFAFEMTPVFAFSPSVNIISNFEKSHITDATLEVEGNQMHVNKSFLSIHSEFFDKLFNSDFKEKSEPIIPIRDVSFSDFSNFLSLIYPNQTEITVEKIAVYFELADKYLMAAVTQKCEEFLLQNPRVKTIQKIVFADNHNLHKLLRVTLTAIETKEELEALTLLPEFTSLSDSTKAALLHKFMHFIN